MGTLRRWSLHTAGPKPWLLQVPYARHPCLRPYLQKNDPPAPRDPATDGPRLCSAPGRPATKSTDWRRCTALRRAGDPDSTRWQLSASAPLATAASLPLGPRSTSSLHNPQLGSRPFWSSWFLWVSTQPPGRSPGSGALPPPRRARVPPSFSRALTRSQRPRLPGWLCHPSSGSSHFPLSKDARKGLALQTFPP